MKKHLWILVIWVVMSNGDVCKYPQAGYYQNGGNPSAWKERTFELIESQSGKMVVALPRYKVSRICYEKPREAKKGYFVYWNCAEGFVHQAYQDSETIIYHGVKCSIENHSTFVPSDEVILGKVKDKK